MELERGWGRCNKMFIWGLRLLEVRFSLRSKTEWEWAKSLRYLSSKISRRLTYPLVCQVKNLQNLPEKTLLENGISSCFPDDQISNLLNCDADKKGSVASPL